MSEAVQEKEFVPTLRFPEFAHCKAPVVELRQMAALVSESLPLSQVGPTSYVSTESLLPGFGGFDRPASLPAVSAVRAYRRNDILVSNIRPYLKKVWYADRDGGASNDVLVFRGNGKANPAYLAQIIRNDRFIGHLMKSAKGVKMSRRDANDALSFSVLCPTDAEQRKIAEFLESLDELIAAETEKLEALKRHKKGLLQQLFPAEGETNPRLRFARYSTQWQRVALRGLLSEPPSYGLNAPATEHRADLPLYLRITDIDEGGNYIRAGRMSVAHRAASDDYLQRGDIAVARTGASVGKSYFCDGKDGPFVYAGFLIRLRADPSKLLPALLAQWLRTDEYWRWVTLTCTRSGQPGINGTEYASAAIPVPTGPLAIQEQLEVASCLSAEDAMIGSLNEKLDNLRTHKAALMQQLFPSTEEIDDAENH
jgi:type I restriction enzyme, S subunit